MSKRNRKRFKCPKCSSKNLRLLNKKQQIWECKRESCGHKFMYIPQSSTYLALKAEDLQIVEANTTPKDIQEIEEIASKAAQETEKVEETIDKDPLLKMAEDFGF